MKAILGIIIGFLAAILFLDFTLVRKKNIVKKLALLNSEKSNFSLTVMDYKSINYKLTENCKKYKITIINNDKGVDMVTNIEEIGTINKDTKLLISGLMTMPETGESYYKTATEGEYIGKCALEITKNMEYASQLGTKGNNIIATSGTEKHSDKEERFAPDVAAVRHTLKKNVAALDPKAMTTFTINRNSIINMLGKVVVDGKMYYIIKTSSVPEALTTIVDLTNAI